MRRIAFAASIAFLAVLLLPTLPPKIVPGSLRVSVLADTQYIYCELTDDSHSKRNFFSAVFKGDYSNNLGYQNDFTAFVQGHYSGVIGVASCLFENDENEANRKQNQSRGTWRNMNREVIDTNWSE